MKSPALHRGVSAASRLASPYLAKIPIRGWVGRRWSGATLCAGARGENLDNCVSVFYAAASGITRFS